MKSIKVSNLGEIRNELNKYKKGKKFDIHQFNQVARLAWLGKVALQPLDPEDPDCKSLLLYVDYPEELAQHFLDTDQELLGHMHIVDGEQGQALVAAGAVVREGFPTFLRPCLEAVGTVSVTFLAIRSATNHALAAAVTRNTSSR